MAVGAGNLGYRTCVRAAARTWPVHASGCDAGLCFPGGIERRTLACGRLFLEYARPRIHALVDSRGVLFSYSRRRLLFPRSFFDRLGGLTFHITLARDPWMKHMPLDNT